MRVSDVIRSKGTEVVTVRPDHTVSELLALLAEHRIGAVVVSTDGTTVDGIVSERDVVRHLHRTGSGVLESAVSTIMTADVSTASPEQPVQELAKMMTDRRIRHVPVVVDGQLRAIVSIGDIVKQRIDELQTERDQLVDYIHQ